MGFGSAPKGPSKKELEEQRRAERAKGLQRNEAVAQILQGRVGRASLVNPGLFVPGSGGTN